MSNRKEQNLYKSAFQKISSNYIIDEKTINQLASSTIIPYVSTKFKLKKQTTYSDSVQLPLSFPVLIIFNRIKKIVTKKYQRDFFRLLKVISFTKKVKDIIKTKSMEYKKESFKAIVRKSNKKYLKEGSERMEKFLFKKILINKVTALKNLQLHLIISKINQKGKKDRNELDIQTVRTERKQIRLCSPRIPKPFELEELYENIEYQNKFWFTKVTNF